MSLDLVVLTSANAETYEQALGAYSGNTAAIGDPAGEIEAYAQEVYDAYGNDDWPFDGDPMTEGGLVQLVVNPESWASEAPRLVERAHKRGLVALDPQMERLFRPGEPYPG